MKNQRQRVASDMADAAFWPAFSAMTSWIEQEVEGLLEASTPAGGLKELHQRLAGVRGAGAQPAWPAGELFVDSLERMQQANESMIATAETQLYQFGFERSAVVEEQQPPEACLAANDSDFGDGPSPLGGLGDLGISASTLQALNQCGRSVAPPLPTVTSPALIAMDKPHHASPAASSAMQRKSDGRSPLIDLGDVAPTRQLFSSPQAESPMALSPPRCMASLSHSTAAHGLPFAAQQPPPPPPPPPLPPADNLYPTMSPLDEGEYDACPAYMRSQLKDLNLSHINAAVEKINELVTDKYFLGEGPHSVTHEELSTLLRLGPRTKTLVLLLLNCGRLQPSKRGGPSTYSLSA